MELKEKLLEQKGKVNIGARFYFCGSPKANNIEFYSHTDCSNSSVLFFFTLHNAMQ